MKRDATKKVVKEVFVETDDLTDKQRLFCIYYIKSFNATMAAIKGGYARNSAHVDGSRLLRNVKVAVEVRRLKGEMHQEVFITAMDVLNKYIQIAFADITDFVEFGSIEMEQRHPETGKVMLDANFKSITYKMSHLDFKNAFSCLLLSNLRMSPISAMIRTAVFAPIAGRLRKISYSLSSSARDSILSMH